MERMKRETGHTKQVMTTQGTASLVTDQEAYAPAADLNRFKRASPFDSSTPCRSGNAHGCRRPSQHTRAADRHAEVDEATAGDRRFKKAQAGHKIAWRPSQTQTSTTVQKGCNHVSN